ncbi:hypothetical protein OQ279_15140 [Salinimicrobium sp. MT39]|uniref:Uncharacterized protein n=1 Tax=Salinimicrobium profundisediminis TaxID=2994553 RepID=A0A9X3I305_9FLAO|nr:hypothetical protein [Salinimicrobium profundisediminis]MCX2839482.1 hypothetical protein [Salinimicrobium profundisediminis]
MEKDKLKLELLEKIIACENEVILKKVEELLFGVSEAGEEYGLDAYTELSQELSISAEQEEELMRRYEDHLQSRGKSYTWEEVKKNLNDSYEL